MTQDPTKELIQKIPLFFGLSPRHMQAFLRICRLTTFAKRETLCEFGTSSNQLFILLEGQLEILTEDGTTLTWIEPVTTVGEMGFISRRPRSATVRTGGPSRLFTVEYHDFEALVENNFELSSRIYRNTVRILYDKLNNANEQIGTYKKHYESAKRQPAPSKLEELSEKTPPEPPAETAPQPPAETPPATDPQPAGETTEEIPVEIWVGPGVEPTGEEDKNADSDEQTTVVDEAEATRLVIDFYTLADLNLDPQQLKKDKAVVLELCKEGYTSADLDYAIRWTVRNIPTAKRFNMVKLSIQEAFEHKWST